MFDFLKPIEDRARTMTRGGVPIFDAAGRRIDVPDTVRAESPRRAIPPAPLPVLVPPEPMQVDPRSRAIHEGLRRDATDLELRRSLREVEADLERLGAGVDEPRRMERARFDGGARLEGYRPAARKVTRPAVAREAGVGRRLMGAATALTELRGLDQQSAATRRAMAALEGLLEDSAA